MDPVALDFETCKFAPGLMAPPPICASTYHPQDGVRIWTTPELPGMVERLFRDPTPILGHGFAYDSCVMIEWFPELAKLVFDKYDSDGIRDTLTTERIIEMATDTRGRLKLDLLAARYGVQVTKSCVQTDFGWLLNRPLSDYPREHKRYVGGDSAELYTLFKRQMNRGIVAVRDLADLCRGDLWLRLSSNYGIRTDPDRVHTLEQSTQEDVDDLTLIAQCLNPDGSPVDGLEPLMRGNIVTGDGLPTKWFSRNMKAIKARVRDAYGEDAAPRTDGGDISCSKIALDESGDWLLEKLAHLGELLAVRNKDVKMLKAGIHAPIHTRYGYAATTRTTSSAPNLQNFRRASGIRECLMPRPGCVFLGSDYPGLESFTLAQVCVWKLGRRAMLNSLNAGRDLHAEVGAGILGISYDEIQARRKAGDAVAKTARDCGKYGNFGLTGYMTNPETFAHYVNMGSRTEDNPRGLRWGVNKAAEVIAAWRKNAHDQVAFLQYVDTLKNSIGKYDVEIPGTTIVRRGCTRTAAANTHFQGLGATVARRAGWLLARAQYVEKTHPGRTVLFVHDEFVTEVAEDKIEEAARIQEACMLQAVREICPDVSLHSEANEGPVNGAMLLDSAAMRHYSKRAKHAREEDGRLRICQT